MDYYEHFKRSRDESVERILIKLPTQNYVKQMLLEAFHAGRESVFAELRAEKEAILKVLAEQDKK